MSLEEYVLYNLAMNEIKIYNPKSKIHIGQCIVFNKLESRVYKEFNITKEEVHYQNLYPVVVFIPSYLAYKEEKLTYRKSCCRVINFQPLFTNHKNIVCIDLQSDEPVKLIPSNKLCSYIVER